MKNKILIPNVVEKHFELSDEGRKAANIYLREIKGKPDGNKINTEILETIDSIVLLMAYLEEYTYDF